MREKLGQLLQLTLLRYLAASLAALAVDICSFLAFLSLGLVAASAAALGYALGIVAHWLISSRAVFMDNVAARGPQRTRQKAMFVISALLGLGVTTTIIGMASTLGFDLRLAKLVAIGASFMLTWLLRSKFIFATPAAT